MAKQFPAHPINALDKNLIHPELHQTLKLSEGKEKLGRNQLVTPLVIIILGPFTLSTNQPQLFFSNVDIQLLDTFPVQYGLLICAKRRPL